MDDSEEKLLLRVALQIAHYTGWSVDVIREMDDIEINWALEIIKEIEQKQARLQFAVADYILAYQAEPTKKGSNGKYEADVDASIRIRRGADKLRVFFTGEEMPDEEKITIQKVQALTGGKVEVEVVDFKEFLQAEEES